MIPFLESFGTDKAERCLAEFTACVRNLDATGLSARSAAVLEGELAALVRRAQAARVELAEQHAELARHEARLCAAIAATERSRDAAGPDGDLAGLIEDLRIATATFDAERKGIERSGQWLGDLEVASALLAQHIASDSAEDAGAGAGRALVRAISEISVAVDAMTVAARTARQDQDALRQAGRDVRLEAVLRNPLVSGRTDEVAPVAGRDPSEMLHHLMRDLAKSGAAPRGTPAQNRKLN